MGAVLKAISAHTTSAKISFAAVASLFLYVLYIFILPTAVRYFSPPPLQVDDSHFFLISYSWLNGLGFNNFWVNPVGTTVFNWHGFLQPMLVAKLSPCNSLRCVNAGLIAVGCIYFAIWYVIVNTITDFLFLRCASYVIAVSLILDYSARPELLASLGLVCIVFLFYVFPDNKKFVVRAVGSGVLVGLTFLTSPITGGFAGLGVAAAVTFLRRNDRTSRSFFIEGTLSLTSALCVLVMIFVFIYPYSPNVWIDGIMLHMIRDAQRTDSSGLLKYFFLRKTIPLLGIMFVPLVGITGLAFKRIWQARNRFFLSVFLLVCAALLYLLYFSTIRTPLTYYNFTALIPSLILVAAICVNNVGVTEQYKRLAFIGPTTAFAVACVFGQAVWAAQWLSERVDHRRLSDSIAASVDHYLAENRRIAMDAPLIGAVDDLEKLKKIEVLYFGGKHKLNYDPPDGDVVFRAQNEFGLSVLAEPLPGFKLVVDNFDHAPLTRLLTPKELYYALYERVRH
jgi:hypothetical protein